MKNADEMIKKALKDAKTSIRIRTICLFLSLLFLVAAVIAATIWFFIPTVFFLRMAVGCAVIFVVFILISKPFTAIKSAELLVVTNLDVILRLDLDLEK